jgi:hypothetical protein
MVLRAALWVHCAGAAAFLWLQPRGFSCGSRGFWEHQVLVPLYFALSTFAAACPARWPRWRLAAAVLPCGFWAVVGGVFAATGSTVFARGLWAPCAAAVALVALAVRSGRVAWSGTAAGVLLGALFLACTWAPPASTRPGAVAPPLRHATPANVHVEGRFLTLEHEGRRITLDPSFRFNAASSSGSWTVFDHRRVELPAWSLRASLAQLEQTAFSASADGLRAAGQVWAEGDEIHVRVQTTLERDVAAHLASVFTVFGAREVRLNDIPWPADEPIAFAAFRRGSLALLRASSREKGPFETLGSWPPGDPKIDAGGWSIQVRGWAEQASREESPTAGWGVSQGAIENWGGTLTWSLASTSIGRGWHAVRTAAGTYVLEAVIRPLR